MSKSVSTNRAKLMTRVAAISMIAVLGAGCSTDFSRLNDPLTTASLPTKNQREIIKKTAKPDQAFPGDVDPVTTASISPGPRAAARSRVRVDQPYPGTTTAKVTRKTLRSKAKVDRISTISRSASARSIRPSNSAPEGKYETVREMTPNRRKLYDRLPSSRSSKKTASLAPNVSEPGYKAGWTAVGGTRVRLKKGENVYNLSRRYGVPVKQIVRVNNLKNARDVEAGQRILIPTYTYSRKVAVSAPDSNPVTRASSSSREFRNQTASSRVAVPTPKVTRSARLQPYPSIKAKKDRSRIVSKRDDRRYTVVAGDTLSGIAGRFNVRKDDLRRANSIKGDVVRLGQKLNIPAQSSGNSSRVVAKLKRTKKIIGVDSVVTGGPATIARKNKQRFAKTTKPANYTKPAQSAAIARRSLEQGPTPGQTGVSTFRWPARGRIVSKFGTKVNGAPNDGIDISVPVGTAVKATENGTVIYAGNELEEFGKLILVRHSNGWVSAYAYSSKNLVSRGDTVRRGQTIARSGRSGNATTPKIHFELRKNSNPVNPLKHLKRS